MVEVKSISTDRVQSLYLDKSEADALNGKNVLIVDDVISTGESLHAMEVLINQSGGNIVGKCAVLAEGDAAKRDDIIYLRNCRYSLNKRIALLDILGGLSWCVRCQ